MSEFDTMKYFMAAEKVGSLIFHMETTLEFLAEYSIQPDENVRKELKIRLDKLQEWLK